MIAFNRLADQRDLQRTIAAVRFVYKILQTSFGQGDGYAARTGIYAEMQRNLTTQSKRNRLLTNIAAKLLDMGGGARDLAMKFIVAADLTLEDAMRDESKLIDWIRRGVQGDWHACGTCRMGAADDRGAVVDPEGRVYGVENLRVVDASVMPSVPCANTNISTIMIGEKMADAILRARSA